MTDFTAQTRPDGTPETTGSGAGRRRADPSTPAAPRSRFARSIGSTGRRAAVLAATCAVILGVGAAGQASGTAPWNANAGNSTEAGAAEPLTPLDFERVRVENQATLPAGGAASQASPVEPADVPAPAAAPAPPAAAPAPAAPAPAPAPAPVAVDDPAGAQAYATSQLGSYGWAPSQMTCLMSLWTKESDWETTATNPSSGAYGVVQSLPAEKMASAGADYRTNYRTQINWGLEYVKDRYGSPCDALNFHYANNWY